jgi:hypothetical protein
MPSSLKDDTTSKCFLAFLILTWSSLIKPIIELYYKLHYLGQTMPVNTWNRILPTNRHPLTILKLIAYVILGFQIYFITIFIPFDIGCGNTIYAHTETMCVSMQIVSFFGMFALCVIGFAVVFIVLAGCLSWLSLLYWWK